MKLTTDKTLIVFYDKLDELYKFCGIKFFKDRFNDGYSIPILYTSSILVARNTKHKLNEGLQA